MLRCVVLCRAASSEEPNKPPCPPPPPPPQPRGASADEDAGCWVPDAQGADRGQGGRAGSVGEGGGRRSGGRRCCRCARRRLRLALQVHCERAKPTQPNPPQPIHHLLPPHPPPPPPPVPCRKWSACSSRCTCSARRPPTSTSCLWVRLLGGGQAGRQAGRRTARRVAHARTGCQGGQAAGRQAGRRTARRAAHARAGCQGRQAGGQAGRRAGKLNACAYLAADAPTHVVCRWGGGSRAV